ncbi:hypothetical protein FAGKG844_40227 [Frankia sp. AgKG'84/4]
MATDGPHVDRFVLRRALIAGLTSGYWVWGRCGVLSAKR